MCCSKKSFLQWFKKYWAGIIFVVMALAFGTPIALTANKYIAGGLNQVAFFGFLCVPFAVSTCLMMCFLFGKKKEFLDKVDTKTSAVRRETELFLERYQEYMGIVIFGTGTIALCFYQMFADSQCLHAFRDFLDHKINNISSEESSMKDLEYHTHENVAADIALQVFKIMFVLFEIAFLVQLDNSKSFDEGKGWKQVLYITITLLISCNTFIWLMNFLDEGHFVQEFPPPYFLQTKHKGLVFRCLNSSSVLQNLQNKMEPLLYPFTTEFSLCAIEVLIHFWKHDSFHDEDVGDPGAHTRKSYYLNSGEVQGSVSPSNNSKSPGRKLISFLFNSKSAMLLAIIHSVGLHSYNEMQETFTTEGYLLQDYFWGSVDILFLSFRFIFNSMVCIATVYVFFKVSWFRNNMKDKCKECDKAVHVRYICCLHHRKKTENTADKTVRYIGCLCIPAEKDKCKCESKKCCLHMHTFIITGLSLGFITVSVLEVVYAFQVEAAQSAHKGLVASGAVILIIQIVFQVFILTYLKNYLEKTYVNDEKFKSIRHVLSFLALSNLGLWATDSFLEVPYLTFKLGQHFGHGKLLHFFIHFTFPLGIYFRYVSSLGFLAIKNKWNPRFSNNRFADFSSTNTISTVTTRKGSDSISASQVNVHVDS